MRVREKKVLHILERTGFINLMSIAKKINPLGFLNSINIAATRLNYLIDLTWLSAIAINVYQHWPSLWIIDNN